MARSATPPQLTYGAFGTWYDEYREVVLEPALDAAMAALVGELVDVLSDRDLARVRSTTGRVKSKRRTWRKLLKPRYAGLVNTVDDIPAVLDDLVGLRITCINSRDIDMVEAALDGVPRKGEGPDEGPALWLDPASERDYVNAPKDSGYRGWHTNLGLSVDVGDTRVPVTCELQVRTLLQDSWGELTHEDTYSKDGALPPLVEVLSKRMADLLAILDDIAEDLRTELDRIDEAVVEGADEPTKAEDSEDREEGGLAVDAATVLLQRWETIDRPTDLASLAWELQRDFGAEVSDGWFGHGNFKSFVRHAVPDGEISTGRQAFLLPRSAAPDTEEATDSTIPGAARQLHRTDRAFPLLEAQQWRLLYRYLADAWAELGQKPLTARTINQLTRSARDRADAAGHKVSRRHLDHVTKAIAAADTSGAPRSADELAREFTSLTVQRMLDLRILNADHPRAQSAVQAWLGGDEG